MGSYPQIPVWSADKAIDGDTNQTYESNSCAITEAGRNTSIWWKLWLQRRFNIAYLEIYFRADSNFIFFLFRKTVTISMYPLYIIIKNTLSLLEKKI